MSHRWGKAFVRAGKDLIRNYEANVVVSLIFIPIAGFCALYMNSPKSLIYSTAAVATLVVWIVAMYLAKNLESAVQLEPLPTANPDKFSVAVVHLENDSPSRETEKLLLRGLQEFPGIQVLSLNREIPTEGGNLDEVEREGRKLAAELLKGCGASALIWGAVVRHDGKSLPQLRWLTVSAHMAAGTLERYVPNENTLTLPSIFWGDLSLLFGLMIESNGGGYQGQNQPTDFKKIQSYIVGTRQLIAKSSGEWTPETRALVSCNLAQLASRYGADTFNPAYVHEAISIYQNCLKTFTRESDPMRWALVNDGLGTATSRLCRLEPEIDRMDEAKAFYLEALTVRRFDNVPIDWAGTMVNLANIENMIGEREFGGVDTLLQALKSTNEVFNKVSPAILPKRVRWALVILRSNILTSLGEKQGELGKFDSALGGYDTLLREIDRQKFPILWVEISFGRGIALLRKGQFTNSGDTLALAEASFRDILSITTPEQNKSSWGRTLLWLGKTLITRGVREPGIKKLSEAVSALEKALATVPEREAPWDWAEAQYQLGSGLVQLGEREVGTVSLSKGIDAFKKALTKYSEKTPPQFAAAKNDLAIALRRKGEREKSVPLLEDSLNHFTELDKFYRLYNNLPAIEENDIQLKRTQRLLDFMRRIIAR